MTVAHVYPMAFQGIEARRRIRQARVRAPSPVRATKDASGLR